MHYNIRPASETDAPIIYRFICALENTSYDYMDFQTILKSNICKSDYYYLVAESTSGIVTGFITCHVQQLLHHCGRVAEIQEFYVDEHYRKQGIGSLLINYLEKKLASEQCVSFEVTAQRKRTETHRFYKMAGFKYSHYKFVKEPVPGS